MKKNSKVHFTAKQHWCVCVCVSSPVWTQTPVSGCQIIQTLLLTLNLKAYLSGVCVWRWHAVCTVKQLGDNEREDAAGRALCFVWFTAPVWDCRKLSLYSSSGNDEACFIPGLQLSAGTEIHMLRSYVKTCPALGPSAADTKNQAATQLQKHEEGGTSWLTW